MSGRRAQWLWVTVGLASFAILGLFLGTSEGATSSTLSRGPHGWRGALRLLEGTERVPGTNRSLEIQLLDQVLEANGALPATSDERPAANQAVDNRANVLWLGLPFQNVSLAESYDSLQRFLRTGGTVIVGYSGRVPAWPEKLLTNALGTSVAARTDALPLHPLRWWKATRVGESHRPAEDAPRGLDAELHTGVLRSAPEVPPGATVWHRDARGRAVVFAFRPGFVGPVVESSDDWWSGRVLLLPADALANAYLANDGNLELLFALEQSLTRTDHDGNADPAAGRRFVFDELHHGLIAVDQGAPATGRRALDLFGAQLLLLYALGAYAVAYRFGPPWPQRTAEPSSHRDFLIGLGALHRRLGHQEAAAERLLERQRLYQGHGLPDHATGTIEGESFLALAQRLSAPERPANRRTDP